MFRQCSEDQLGGEKRSTFEEVERESHSIDSPQSINQAKTLHINCRNGIKKIKHLFEQEFSVIKESKQRFTYNRTEIYLLIIQKRMGNPRRVVVFLVRLF